MYECYLGITHQSYVEFFWPIYYFNVLSLAPLFPLVQPYLYEAQFKNLWIHVECGKHKNFQACLRINFLKKKQTNKQKTLCRLVHLV